MRLIREQRRLPSTYWCSVEAKKLCFCYGLRTICIISLYKSAEYIVSTVESVSGISKSQCADLVTFDSCYNMEESLCTVVHILINTFMISLLLAYGINM